MKSISFDTTSLEAIYAGKKTMTRRPVKWGEEPEGLSYYTMRWHVGDEAYVKTGWTDADGKKHPAMFMPRAQSPFSIRITGHRVESVRDISEADVVAEGIEITHDYQYDFWWRWDSIYKHMVGKRWEDNPLVEVLTFEVMP